MEDPHEKSVKDIFVKNEPDAAAIGSESSASASSSSSSSNVPRVKYTDSKSAVEVVATLHAQVEQFYDKDAKIKEIVLILAKTVKEWDTAPRKEKEIKRQKFLKAESNWNRHVSHLRQGKKTREWAKDLPSINTKTRHVHGNVQKLIDLGVDTSVGDEDPDVKSISLCSHGSHNKKGCWLISPEYLPISIKTAFEDPDKWNFYKPIETYLDKLDKLDVEKLSKLIALKCPILKTDICQQALKGKEGYDENRKTCGALIKLSKILQLLPKDERQKYTRDRIFLLFMQIYVSRGKRVYYCPDPSCVWSKTGLIKKPHDHTKIPLNDTNARWCDFCETVHWVHEHRIDCYCGKSFCYVCKMIPYHQYQMCMGPIVDEDVKKQLAEGKKLCPNCKYVSEKVSGCDRMNCGKCKSNWCWRCLSVLDAQNPYNHKCIGEGLIEGRPDYNYR